MPFLLKPVVLFTIAVVLLRVTGRRSIAQMTIAQTVVIISIGAIIVEPFADKDILKTVVAATLYIIMLMIFEFFEFHWKKFKKVAIGEEITIIKNGQFEEENLRKLKLTYEEVLSRMRQEGIPKLSYIEEGTLEPNGEFGFRLKSGAEPLRVEDMQYILNYIMKERGTDESIDLVQILRKETGL